jgi:hypothetical protein
MATISPSAQLEDIPPAMDFASHERQYYRVVHLVKWFVVHALLLLPALFFMLVGGQPVTGTIFLALALGALGYGVLATPQIARDVDRALEQRPETS